MRSFKVWAYRELSGAKYFEVLLDDRTRLRINFIEGLTTQHALIALGGALGLKLGPCRTWAAPCMMQRHWNSLLSTLAARIERLSRLLCLPFAVPRSQG
jgi:hypothetical protein